MLYALVAYTDLVTGMTGVTFLRLLFVFLFTSLY